MPCNTGISESDEARHFEILLCQACRFLSVDQIKTLTNPGSGICEGLDWYSNHLWLDCNHSNKDVLSFVDEAKRKADLKELSRIGYSVEACEGGEQLVKLKQVYPY